MRALLQIFLICIASNALSQTINLPLRATNAPTGSEFAATISALDLADREQQVFAQVEAGNVPSFLRKLCPVTVTNIGDGMTNVATFFVTPDYLAIGTDEDYLLMPVSPATGQRIADMLDCTLPTRKMVDETYAAAEVKLAPSPIPPSAAMTTVPAFVAHNETVHAQRMETLAAYPPGTLIAGHKKDVVIAARLSTVTNKVAIYGWHRTNGIPIQPLYLGHVNWWVDYSQCTRLVSQTMLVNGEKMRVVDVLADPKLCGLISDEGAITNARYPTNPIIAPVKMKIGQTWPRDFIPGTNFGEMNCEIKLANDVRILINTPDPGTFSTKKPILLVFYALPNGNTIEETFGKVLQPGDDWHFDIQHIGAQTRWLRHIITNQTIVVTYLEAGNKSWPVWRKVHNDYEIVEMIDDVRGIFSAYPAETVLAAHSGGGSLIFGYLNGVPKIPDDLHRIAFLDSDYAYETSSHAGKIADWLSASAEHSLCVLAYQDYLALLNGKTFVSEAGGTWGRSQVMLADLDGQFRFTSRTNAGLETHAALDGRVEFLLKQNPEKRILHTVQVERNGFIQTLLSGTPEEGQGYEYLGERAYTNWIR